MTAKPKLMFKPIDLGIHSELTIMFKMDSFICNFGSIERFGKKNSPQAKQYLERLKNRMFGDPASMVHAWLGDSLVGQIELSADKTNPTIGYVDLYYLIPEMRGVGLSDQLENYAMDYFRDRGYQKARLSVSKANLRAIKFYKRNGWHMVGDNPEDIELTIMEKII